MRQEIRLDPQFCEGHKDGITGRGTCPFLRTSAQAAECTLYETLLVDRGRPCRAAVCLKEADRLVIHALRPD